MVRIYREIFVELIVLILVGGSLIFIPLYINSFLTSMHIIGPDWNFEIFIVGDSMRPTLSYGDFVCVRKTDVSLIRTGLNGDIIAFERPQPSISNPAIIVHRAINRTVRNSIIYFQTKGDNNNSPDNWSDYRGENYTWNGMVSELLLIGKVVGVRKEYAVVFPVAIMTSMVLSLAVGDIILYFYLLHGISFQRALKIDSPSHPEDDEPAR
ncbi:MAG: signal peptidase I [Candidatus Bathyarchaeia archaeon]